MLVGEMTVFLAGKLQVCHLGSDSLWPWPSLHLSSSMTMTSWFPSVALQQVLNASLRTKIDSPWWAVFVSYFVGMMAMLAVALAVPGPRLTLSSLGAGGHEQFLQVDAGRAAHGLHACVRVFSADVAGSPRIPGACDLHRTAEAMEMDSQVKLQPCAPGQERSNASCRRAPTEVATLKPHFSSAAPMAPTRKARTAMAQRMPLKRLARMDGRCGDVPRQRLGRVYRRRGGPMDGSLGVSRPRDFSAAAEAARPART